MIKPYLIGLLSFKKCIFKKNKHMINRLFVTVLFAFVILTSFVPKQKALIKPKPLTQCISMEVSNQFSTGTAAITEVALYDQQTNIQYSYDGLYILPGQSFSFPTTVETGTYSILILFNDATEGSLSVVTPTRHSCDFNWMTGPTRKWTAYDPIVKTVMNACGNYTLLVQDRCD
jgi:hypothetical protein